MNMNQDNFTVFPTVPLPTDEYDDDDIPQVDLPQDRKKGVTQGVTPDEVPRKDGPGGESGV